MQADRERVHGEVLEEHGNGLGAAATMALATAFLARVSGSKRSGSGVKPEPRGFLIMLLRTILSRLRSSLPSVASHAGRQRRARHNWRR